MARTFETAPGDLADRMMAALVAAQEQGGDIRGKQSAAMLVVGGQKTERPWEHVFINIRVDDHPEPLVELQRLLKIQRAYHLMNEGDALLGKKDYEKAAAQLNRSCAGQKNGLPNLSVAQWIYDKYKKNDKARKLFGVHHWEYTYLFALFAIAKKNGK